MSNARRKRGRDTERIVTDYLGQFWEGLSRVEPFGKGSDVRGVPGFDIEIKSVAKIDLPGAFKQSEARRKGDEKSLIILRLNGQGNPEDYIACMRLKELVPIINQTRPSEGVTRCEGCGDWIVIERECMICRSLEAMAD